ncbi:MAG: TolC family protein, partial [Oligoflexia bacterium]|nr:TolC family protein [Oligoflexia bacterium]
MHDISRTSRHAAALLMVLLGMGGPLSPLAHAANGAEAGAATALIASAAVTPTALADEAVAANPSLVSQQAMADQLHELAAVAGAWPDPVAAIEYSNVPLDTWSISDHPMAGIQLRLQQTLHPPGWSRQQREVGELRATVAEAMVDESAVALRAAVEQTWWGLVQTRLLRQVTVDHIARTDELLAAVRSRYQVGQAGQSAVLRLTVLRDRLTDDLGDYTRRDAELVAALDDALARDRASAATPSVYDTPSVLAPLPPPADAD